MVTFFSFSSLTFFHFYFHLSLISNKDVKMKGTVLTFRFLGALKKGMKGAEENGK